MTGAAIDRLLAIYSATHAASVRAGHSSQVAKEIAREACDDFTAYVSEHDAKPAPLVAGGGTVMA